MSYCPKCKDLVDVDHERVSGEIHDMCCHCNTDITLYERLQKNRINKKKRKA